MNNRNSGVMRPGRMAQIDHMVSRGILASEVAERRYEQLRAQGYTDAQLRPTATLRRQPVTTSRSGSGAMRSGRMAQIDHMVARGLISRHEADRRRAQLEAKGLT